jgi:hypothetical protein
MSFVEEFPVSAQVDDMGAIEVTFRHRFARSGAEAPPYDWPATKTLGSSQLALVSSREVTEMLDEGVGTSEATYRGAAFSKKFVFVEGTITNEPITAHPDFEDWAGTEDDPNAENAIWEDYDGRKRFIQFRDDYALAGITTYLAPQWTFNLTFMSDDATSALVPGKIYSMPSIPNFSLFNGLDLLSTSVAQEQNGAAWRIQVQLLGAPDWSSDLYT